MKKKSEDEVETDCVCSMIVCVFFFSPERKRKTGERKNQK